MTAVHRGPVAVRAYVAPTAKRRARKSNTQNSDLALVLDCETAIDSGQRLLFGSYRVYRRGKLVQEGLIHPDGCEPADMALLEAYVAGHPSERGGQLRLVSRSHFANEIIWRVGYVGRAVIVGFNLAFDLSRLAVGHARSRSGGFSLWLWQSRDTEGRMWRHQYRPDVTVKHLGSKRQFISFTTPARLDAHNRVDGKGYRGTFCDLRMAAYALTDRSLSLDGAAAVFGIVEGKADAEHTGAITEEYVHYNRQDVRVTWLLYQALGDEWASHGLDVPLSALYSGASVGKAYLDAMGIRPPLDKAK